jgi:hypothetical protein
MAGRYNMLCDQGSTFSLTFTIRTDGVPWALNNYTARMQVRSFINAETIIVELSTANGRITYGPAAGKVNLLIDAATTTVFPTGRHTYDLEFTAVAGVTVEKILSGKFIVRGEVTRNGN